MSVPGLVAAGHYAVIAENVDLEYKIIGEQVKENLILILFKNLLISEYLLYFFSLIVRIRLIKLMINL